MSERDPVQERVLAIVRAGVRRAYGPGRRPDPEPVCDGCGGDGCPACDFTGDAAATACSCDRYWLDRDVRDAACPVHGISALAAELAQKAEAVAS